MIDMNKVARNIKNARTKKNMTQLELADIVGVSYQAVSNWERGNSMPDIGKITAFHRIVYQFALEFHIPGKIQALKRLLSSKKYTCPAFLPKQVSVLMY